MKRNFSTLANQITIVRIIIIPVIVILLLEGMTPWAAGLLAFSVLTDLLDGMAARILKEQTAIGAFLDPMADKLLLSAVYLTLAYLKVIDIWLFVVIFSRDLLIVLGWGLIYILTRSWNVSPRPLGKITTGVQMVASLAFVLSTPRPFRYVLLWAIGILTVASIVDYIIIGEKKLGEWA